MSAYKAVLFDKGGTLTHVSIGGKKQPEDPLAYGKPYWRS